MAILVYDSGIGGLPYLKLLQQKIPWKRFIYYADTQFFPFGEGKSHQLVDKLETNVVDAARCCQAELILLACNTASVLLLERLRKRLAIPVVATVPALKPAILSSQVKKVALLATHNTCQADYTDKILTSYAQDCQIERYAAGKLINFIELQLFQATVEQVEEQLQTLVEQVVAMKIDRLVLGCTHFLHIADHLKRLLPSSIVIVDSLSGVARQVQRLLQPPKRRILYRQKNNLLWLHGSLKPRWYYWSNRYKLHLTMRAPVC